MLLSLLRSTFPAPLFSVFLSADEFLLSKKLIDEDELKTKRLTTQRQQRW
jgi:hypothetical protein